jgi:hypothetical protein
VFKNVFLKISVYYSTVLSWPVYCSIGAIMCRFHALNGGESAHLAELLSCPGRQFFLFKTGSTVIRRGTLDSI